MSSGDYPLLVIARLVLKNGHTSPVFKHKQFEAQQIITWITLTPLV
ncbi:hypothetical protein KM917_04345 [Virgibacillus pantothenticus]|nr:MULTISPECIES: hypothetical protein [Virgibacillus]MBU8659050.1 hypothetical protein [Virgibacillus pantothenticus]MBU8667761.1 hypothetical protein [Virgibacillus pantothenticus]